MAMPKFKPELANSEKNIKDVFNRNMAKLASVVNNIDMTNFSRSGIIRKDLIHKDVFRDFITTDATSFPFTDNSVLVFDGITGKKAKEARSVTFPAVVTVTDDYTATIDNRMIIMDGSSNSVTVTLPADPVVGQVFKISVSDATNTCDIDFNGNTFDGDTGNFEMYEDESLEIIYSDTLEWRSGG